MSENIENKAKNILLFTGENGYLLEKALEKARRDFVAKYGEMNMEIMETEEEWKDGKLSQALTAAPFLSEKRLIILKNFLKVASEEDQEAVKEALEEIPETSVVIFYEHPQAEGKRRQKTNLFHALEKTAIAKEYGNPSEHEIIAWINNRLKKNNATISENTAHKLAIQCNMDMQILSNEIAKLGLYCQERNVTDEDIDKLIAPNPSATIFELIDRLNEKNENAAIKKLHILIDMGEEILQILGMLARHFRLLILVKDIIEHQKIRKTMVHEKMKMYDPTLKPYPIKRAIEQSNAFDFEQLKDAYRTLFELQIRLKTGKIPQGPSEKHLLLLELETLIFRISSGKIRPQGIKA